MPGHLFCYPILYRWEEYVQEKICSRQEALVRNRPFRSPHHTISDAGLIGGGHMPKPGEVSLAHNGVLFLDELPEYGAYALDLLREPMEEGRLTIVRKGHAVEFPARFLLVGAMNPCRCGGGPGAARRHLGFLRDRRQRPDRQPLRRRARPHLLRARWPGRTRGDRRSNASPAPLERALARAWRRIHFG